MAWSRARGCSTSGTAFRSRRSLGGIGIVLLLDATRRAIGIPLVIVCSIFLVYSIFGQSMPDIVSHKGLSLNRLIGYQWLTGEAVFGIPISVSVSFVFLFVLFGALLDKAGAGQYFLSLSFALVGRFSGGPAKAAILASGMTGMISGSSIANVVTTGTFTIPVMRRMGMPAVKAGAIEVAASTNGQIMPPIMGAAAFIIAEFVGISYVDVVVAAAIPAALSYIALFYISHLEAQKLGLAGLPRAEIPALGKDLHQRIAPSHPDRDPGLPPDGRAVERTQRGVLLHRLADGDHPRPLGGRLGSRGRTHHRRGHSTRSRGDS